jgi:DNA repair protein RadC
MVLLLIEQFRPWLVAHDHLSEWAEASAGDIQGTKEVVKAEKMLDTQLLNHLIIRRQHYVSLNERKSGLREDE